MPSDVLFPRVRGNAVQQGSAWGWEAFVTVGDHEPVGLRGRKTFISKAAAIADLEREAHAVLRVLVDKLELGEIAGFIDLNKNVMRTVDKDPA